MVKITVKLPAKCALEKRIVVKDKFQRNANAKLKSKIRILRGYHLSLEIEKFRVIVFVFLNI
jgi:hypothetical protein